MARQRNPKRDEARSLWEADRDRPLKDIADELGITSSTVRKWKSQDNWEQLTTTESPPKRNAPKGNKTKRSAPIEKERSFTESVIDLQDEYGLTEMQKTFAEAYIETGNASSAAEKAGYNSPGQAGYRLLKNVQIKRYINERLYGMRTLQIMTADEALKELSAIAFGLVEETVVVGTPVGAETVDRPVDPRTRMSAIKEILKRYPDNDRLLDAQIRRAEAEAVVSEAKAAAIQTTGAEQERQDEQIDRLLAGIETIAQEERRKEDEENG